MKTQEERKQEKIYQTLFNIAKDNGFTDCHCEMFTEDVLDLIVRYKKAERMMES